MEIEHAASAPRRDELAYRLRQQRLLAEFGRVVLQERDAASLLQRATELCAAGLEAPYCKALEYEAATDLLVMKGGWGWKPGEVGSATLGADLESPAGYAFHTGQPVLSNHLMAETRFRTPKLLLDYGIKRAVNVLVDRGGTSQRAFGVLEVDSPDPGDFDEADVEFLSGCAGILGVAMERNEADRRLKAAFETQAMLTREMSHRVKNSLGVVAALLRLNGASVADPVAKAALDDAEARVMTVAKVHDHLWKGADVTEVELAPFLADLCAQLARSTSGVEVHCVAEELALSADRAVPLGLVVNELVTNALKYAYGPSEAGRIDVTLSRTDRSAVIAVRDYGRGLPDGFDLEAARKSFGIRVITNLARQLDAGVSARNTGTGACFEVTFDHVRVEEAT